VSEFQASLRDADNWLLLTREQRDGVDSIARAYQRDIMTASLRYVASRALAGTINQGYIQGAVENVNYLDARWGILERDDSTLAQELVAIRKALLDYATGAIDKVALGDVYAHRDALHQGEDDLEWDEIEIVDADLDWDEL